MAEAITTDQPLHGPSDKERKYDRQLRLWAAGGQAALEDAHILLLNSGPGVVGVEVLKNLVLPGIGKFTIADGAVVRDADLGVNFFLDDASLGKSRAQRCAELLQELNPDVQGCWFPRGESFDIRDLLGSAVPYTLIIYTFPIGPETLALVERYSQLHKIPLVSINCVGFYSYFRIHFPGSFPIVDTHPDSTATTDLRLLSPWPELSSFAQEMVANIDSQDAHTHGHIPYVALLLHYLGQWKGAHENNLPHTYAEKIAFRDMIAAAARTDNPEGGEENFDEACAAVLKAISAPSLSSSVREVFEYNPDQAEATSSFWIITDAIKRFYSENNALPLPGAVPDMKAQSDVYVRLQNIYKSKARKDLAEVMETIQTGPRGNEIGVEEVESYCRNAAFIKLIRGSEGNPVDLRVLADAELNAEFALTPSLMPIYLALKATEKVGGLSQGALLLEISGVVPNAKEDERIVQVTREVVRAKGGELHNISALTGGMVAQEIIKIITKQYIPINNTCIVDGISSTTQVLRT